MCEHAYVHIICVCISSVCLYLYDRYTFYMYMVDTFNMDHGSHGYVEPGQGSQAKGPFGQTRANRPCSVPLNKPLHGRLVFAGSVCGGSLSISEGVGKTLTLLLFSGFCGAGSILILLPCLSFRPKTFGHVLRLMCFWPNKQTPPRTMHACQISPARSKVRSPPPTQYGTGL